MSYTQLDWLNDLMSAPNVDIGQRDVLATWMREDGRAIVRRDEHEALVGHARGMEHDHDLCDLAIVHWDKEKRDWER